MFLLNIIQQPLPPYVLKTGKSLWVERPDNFGRPLVTVSDEDETNALPSIAKRLGISKDPMDNIVVSTKVPDPKKIDSKLGVKN